MKTCTTCKYYKEKFFDSSVCLHPACVKPAFEYTDPVTGKTSKYEQSHEKCYLARIFPCYRGGILWEAK